MLQIKELMRWNKAGLKTLLGIPLLWIIVIIPLFIYLTPVWGSMSRIYSTKKAVLADDNLSMEEAGKYLSRLENDQALLDALIWDEKLNVALLKLYTRTEDYDSLLRRGDAALKRKDTRAYDPYLMSAYNSRQLFYRKFYDAGISAFYARRFDEAVEKLNFFLWEESRPSPLGGNPDIYKEENENLKQQARLAFEAIHFVRPFDEAVSWGNLGDIETEILSEKTSENQQLLEFVLNNQAYNLTLLDFYLKKEDYEKTISRADMAIATDDLPSYHYYLGVAYSKTDRSAAAVKEMKIFLTRDPEAVSGNRLASQREYADLFLARHYSSQENYKESNRLLETVLRERAALASGTRGEILKEIVAVIINRQLPGFPVVDSDRDGLSDGLEDLLGLDKNNHDADKDRIRDGNEFLAGRSPWKKTPEDLYTQEDYYELYTKLLNF